MNLKDRLNKAYAASQQAPQDGAGRRGAADSHADGRGARPKPVQPKAAPGSAVASKHAKPHAARSDGASTEVLQKSAVQAEGLFKSGLPGIQKAAKFLLLLGPEEAAQVIRHLKPGEIERVSREIALIDHIDTLEANTILAEFGWLVKTKGASISGGMETAESMLVAALGADKARDVLRRAMPDAARPFQFLNVYDAKGLLSLLKDESAHVLSVVLPYIEPKLAGDVIVALPDPIRVEVVRRIAHLEKVDPETLRRVEAVIREKVRRLGTITVEEVDGRSALANILKHVDTNLEETLLANLYEENPELSDSIRDRLFTSEDVLRVADRDMQSVLRDLDERRIALVLKGKTQAFREKLFENVSSNRRILIQEEYDILGSVRRDEVDKATREFLDIFKRKFERGDLALHDDDEFVN